jgi:hypothetical protein
LILAKEYDMDNPSLLEIMVEYCICSFRAHGGIQTIIRGHAIAEISRKRSIHRQGVQWSAWLSSLLRRCDRDSVKFSGWSIPDQSVP